MIRMAGAAHKLARDARIGLRDADVERLLGLRDGLADRLADEFDVLDPPGMNALDGFRDQREHLHEPLGILLADGHRDRRGAQIDGNDIILPFHCIMILFFLQTT